MTDTVETVTINKDDLKFMIDMLNQVYEGGTITAEDHKRLNSIQTDNTDHKIRMALKNLGIRQNVLGYMYLQAAIKMACEDRTVIQNITKILYPNVAKMYGTTASRVERAIRHAVEISFDSLGNDEFKSELFGWNVDGMKGKPTNSHFIAAVAEYIGEH